MLFVIWSYRKRMWWKADREGYTPDLNEAGIYSDSEAGDIMLEGLPGANVAVDEVLAARNSLDFETAIEGWRRI